MNHSPLFPRPASEYSSPSGRPLSCVVDENTPVMTPVNGAEASVPQGVQRVQERRVRSQRHRNYMSRTHLHTPPDLPEGYGERQSITHTHTHTHIHIHIHIHTHTHTAFTNWFKKYLERNMVSLGPQFKYGDTMIKETQICQSCDHLHTYINTLTQPLNYLIPI